MKNIDKNINADLDINKQIGMQIKSHRKILGITQRQLAKSLAKPISVQQLWKYENGMTNISIKTLFDIAKVLRISLNKLIICNTNNADNFNDKSQLILKNEFDNTNNINYLSDIAKIFSNIESVALKDKIIECIKVIATS